MGDGRNRVFKKRWENVGSCALSKSVCLPIPLPVACCLLKLSPYPSPCPCPCPCPKVAQPANAGPTHCHMTFLLTCCYCSYCFLRVSTAPPSSPCPHPSHRIVRRDDNGYHQSQKFVLPFAPDHICIQDSNNTLVLLSADNAQVLLPGAWAATFSPGPHLCDLSFDQKQRQLLLFVGSEKLLCSLPLSEAGYLPPAPKTIPSPKGAH